ncbi:hypothetical protein BGZ75_004342 [Mortierella antarctica]|nr:hypothetical protein BGZ67_008071 [Mortierella alpina]KAF9989954.1 hypothetical protein BGZ75_004342 [Mortierella antarctica]
MRFAKSLLLSTAAVALLSMVAAQDAAENSSPNAVGEAGIPDLIVIESDPASAYSDEGDDEGDNYGDNDGEDSSEEEASAAAIMAADNTNYNHKLCPLWGKTALIMDANFFCMFLPVRGQRVDSALKDTFVAAPACTSQLSRVLGTDSLPYGFIQSSRVTKGPKNNWIQVTGKMDPTQYDFHKKDQGAAYHHGIAKGATCLGYSHFLQFIEPNSKMYCLRCCKNKQDCPVEKSREGCWGAFGNTVKV